MVSGKLRLSGLVGLVVPPTQLLGWSLVGRLALPSGLEALGICLGFLALLP